MTDPGATLPRSASAWREAWRHFRGSRRGMFGLALLLFFFVIAFFAPMIANHHPVACRHEGAWHFPAVVETAQGIPVVGNLFEKSKPFRFKSFDFKESFDADRDWKIDALVPFGPLESSDELHRPPSGNHLLGTDSSGRDVLSRLIHGTSISMRVGFISMGIAALLGLLIGAVAGYFGGWVDMLLSRFIEVVICFPAFFLILAVLAWFPPRIENVMIVIGLTRWVGIARMTRGEFLRLRDIEYSVAARALGATAPRIVLRHLLPNSLAPVLVQITFGIAAAILVESGLSWLGLGVQLPYPSWGNVLREGYDLKGTSTHIIPPACLVIFLSVLCFNLVGDALRDAVDPKVRGDDSRRG